MRTFCYWGCFTLVALVSLSKHVTLLMALIGNTGAHTPSFAMLSQLGSIGGPRAFAVVGLSYINMALGLFVLFLLVRRVWLLLAKRQGIPESFTGVPKKLGYTGAWMFMFASAVLLLSMVLHAGSGVPAGLLMVPAYYFSFWAILLTELFSLRRGNT
jgi:hypothetical protein